MTDNGTLIVTLGRLGSGVYQAVRGLLWEGTTPTAANPAYAGAATITDRAGTPNVRDRAGLITLTDRAGYGTVVPI